jgi:hypothetical protein
VRAPRRRAALFVETSGTRIMNELFRLGRVTEETMGSSGGEFQEVSGESCTTVDHGTDDC